MSPPVVRVLPEAVANQIAAGEVVERPASVVKELVENALDAGASRVKIEVLGGGLRSIRVEDDGHGMPEPDARLALTRHATSKLRSAEDLESVASLGFRGEALPSIASVCRFELRTAVRGSDAGTLVRVEGGGPLVVEPCPPVPGTQVEAADLFFNLPARRKFLRQPPTELGHVTEVVTRLALAHPEVGFHLLAEGRSALQAPALPTPDTDPRPRLGRLLGRAVAEGLVPLDDDGLVRSVEVRGYFGAPPLSDRGVRGQHVFVNGRFVRDRTVASAITEAFQGRLPRGRGPVVLLHVRLDPRDVDVNVHPQKTEVRFARSGEVFRAVQSALRRGLSRIGSAPTPEDPAARRRRLHLAADPVESSRIGPASAVAEPTLAVSPTPTGGLAPPTDEARSVGGSSSHVRPAPRPEPSVAFEPAVPYRGHGERLLSAFSSAPKRLARWTSPKDPPPPVSTGSRPAAASLPLPAPTLSETRRLGVVFGRYLMLEAEGALWFADLAGISARVAAERSAVEGVGPTQPLLVPLGLELGPAARGLAESEQAALAAAGLELGHREGRVVLLGAPARAAGLDLARVVELVLERLEDGVPADAAVLEAVARTDRAGGFVPTAPEEVDRLLAALERCTIRDRAPDGRPLVVALSRDRIAALFGGTG